MNEPAASGPVRPEPATSSPGPGDVERQLELLAAIAQRTANGVIVTTTTGRIEWVNDGFTRLTGFPFAEAIGRRPADLLQGPDTSATTVKEMSRAIAERRPFDVVVLNYTKTGQQYWVRVEAQPTVDRAGNVTGYIAIETDVSEARIAAGREDVTKRIGDGLLACGSIEDAAKIVVAALTSTLDVRAAQVWVVEPGHEHLRWLTGASADDDGRDWIAAGAAQTFRAGDDWIVGVGAPGMAWGTGRPCIKSDFWVADNNGQFSRRSAAAQRARIRTVCAVPVLGPEGVVAVIEIGGSHNYPGHERLPGLVERVAQQLAAFILQHQSRHAFEALFRQSPDALLLVDGAGVVDRANARAQDLFGAVRGQPLQALLDDADALLSTATSDGDAVVIHTRQGRTHGGTQFSAEVTVSSTTATATPMRIVAVRDLTERHRADAALKKSLEEKQTLVQEVHHRVKNNLQIISSLVSLQSAELDGEEVRAALQDTSQRIQSMALVHQQIYGSDDLARVEFDDYARALCTTLRGSLAPDAALTIDAVAVELPIERAVPCGLILNELLTNAFKHGRGKDGRCAVHVVVERTATGFAFTVADEGPGLSPEPARRGSMGQTLITALVRQLRATKTVAVVDGTRVRIEVPDTAR
jgi:PAS domain S-box-containing protein